MTASPDMPHRILAPLLLVSLTLAAGWTLPAGEPDPAVAEEMILQEVGLSIDGPGLLEFFRTRSRSDASPERIAERIKALHGMEATARGKAVAELVAIGPSAIPLLR